ncbi:hypothetical protein JP75_08110 [Devosia riboflavina]|uniref:Uncharacterized protein n=1 Tax=Devosia riboflavina TaxID=46914 RepID=A0A087M3N7_9HYPH|nr:hypothetical protein [Devosia riboflavina]KFL31490.1 hypothetical protein JP75_08110 [Devosia riboflavina]
MKAAINQVWDFIVRWRTRLFNGIGALLVLVAPLLGAPEVQAVIPAKYLPYVIAAVFIINVWMRPRVAATKDDAEVQVRETLKAADGPAVITVKTPSNSKTIVNV